VRNLFRKSSKYFTIPAETVPREIPENLWVRCTRCGELLYVKEFERNLKVCPKCDFHFRLSALERIHLLTDPGSFVEEDADLQPGDPLGFVSMGQAYRDKIAETQARTSLTEAIVAGRGRLDGIPVQIAAADFSFIGASMGSVVGEKVARTMERALATGEPVVIASCSGGARMQEGIFSLMQMAKTASAVARLERSSVPFISVLTDPTSGGVTASFASLGDVTIAEPGAFVGFAGPRLIEQITKQKLPPGFQTAEFVLEHGMIDMVVHRRELKATIAKLLRLYTGVAGYGS